MAPIAYFQTLVNMYRIIKDDSFPEHYHEFASLFRMLFQINLNVDNNETFKAFKQTSELLLMTYFHRVVQLIEKTLDQKESESDFNELKEMVHSIHQAILTNKNLEWTANVIAKQVGSF